MENKFYIAKDGMTFVRKIDGYRMGDKLYLDHFIDGTEDLIENYIQDKKTPEEIKQDEQLKAKLHKQKIKREKRYQTQ